MHTEVLDFFKKAKYAHPSFFFGKKVLEVGSLYVNGSVRDFFENCDYTGIDIGEGSGVDVVCKAHEYIHPEAFDVVVSTEMLEHDEYWPHSLATMYMNLKPGGLFVFTCAGPRREEHGTARTNPDASPFTNNYYRNISKADFKSVLPKSYFTEYKLRYVRLWNDLQFCGIKRTP